MLVFEFNNIYVISSIFLIFIVFIKIILGYEKDRNRFKKDAIMNVFIYVMLYHILTYIAGIFIGFVRTIYSLSFLSIIQNILPIISSIIVIEILRYMINKKAGDNKYLLMYSTVVFVLVEIMFLVALYSYQSSEMWLTIIALAILPTISKNILLNYMAIHYGFLPGILYRLLMEIPDYILPIFPNFNDYMIAIFGFILPLVILFIIYRDTIKKAIKKDKEFDSSLKKHFVAKISGVILIIITFTIIVLTSGLFKYFTLSIGSGSMEPNLNIGDVVVVQKISEEEISELKVDDILVYEKDDVVIVHRIDEIRSEGDNSYFITKGDNNKEADNWLVDEATVLGKVSLRIPLIGYPTIWINDLIE